MPHQPPPDYVEPKWLAWFRRYIFVIAFVLGAITLTVMRPLTRRVPDPPAVMFQLPADYRLVDHRGEPFTPETMRGKVWVAGFVFTRCPSSCPAVTRAMADLRARLDRMEVPVEMVSFTVDPEHDTQQVLADYANTLETDLAHWRFVTGTPEDIRALIGAGFRLGLGEREDQGGGLYDIAHSTKLALIDGDGGVRGYYGIEPDLGLDEIFHRAQHVLREQNRTR